MNNKNSDKKEAVFITGATLGLGRLTAKKLINLGHKVIISGRSEKKINDAYNFILADSPQNKGNLYSVVLDLIDLKSVKTAVEKVESLGFDIDVLVNNAGGTRTEFKQTNEGIEDTIFMNAVGPLYLTKLMIPLIEKSQHPNKRILFVGSSIHDPNSKGGGNNQATKISHDVDIETVFEDKEHWNSMKYYKLSKLASIWDAYLVKDKYPHLTTIVFCPGFVPTTDLIRNSSYMVRLTLKYAISKFNFTTSEDDSTDDYIYYITTSGTNLKSGGYYEKRQLSKPSDDALNRVKQQQFWDLAMRSIDQLT
ncbi:hypothetical protein [Parasitella parasitica]|uniref:Ketoreductase (KR) domain-containing protein n=1 Tax=Parasitella parasitica TaxID=35722 RepID=A0A0B7NMM9_9FUNG|nr:hypothetical protein [Parasitella parasitica]